MESESVDNNNSLRGSAIITGASGGIGHAIALNLAEENFNLGLIGRDREQLEKVADECETFGIRAIPYQVDFNELPNLDELISKITDELGPLKALVNNAGIFIEDNIENATLQDWDLTFNVNVRAVFAFCKACLPYLSDASEGAIINISSVADSRGYKDGASYAASKFALKGLTESLFQDLREKGIKVSLISPGFVNTDMHKDHHHLNKEKMIQPKDIGEAVRFVVNFPANACPTQITIVPQRDPKIKE